ncbi:hypothetical protein CSUI_010497 [Cystoisospora suis]|uniref:Uncharacterized protein n=1 Tax=Cystoisospora suis TaxID=483139 RepID=A0A2C6JXM5_9APIC|nr:hypothetical protein CSUI_010497 [Cystoisospora suis]
MKSPWTKKARDMLRGVSVMLRNLLILQPTGPTRAQVGITAVSVGYLGHVWWIDGQCPLLPRSSSSYEQERGARMKESPREEDEEEKKLQRELGVTTFAEWKERGFIPEDPAKKKKKMTPHQEEDQSSSSSE